MEKKSKIIKGNIEDVEKQIDELINKGFKVHSFTHEEPGYFYVLLLKE